MSYRYRSYPRSGYGKSYRRAKTTQLFNEFIRFSASVGDNSFTEEEVQMPIPRNSPNLIPCVHAIEFWTPDLEADGEYWKLHVSRKSKSAIGTFDDSDIIFLDGEEYQLTTSGATARHFRKYHEFRYPVPIPNMKLFVGMHHDTDTTKTIHGRLHYSMRRVTEADIMEAYRE